MKGPSAKIPATTARPMHKGAAFLAAPALSTAVANMVYTRTKVQVNSRRKTWRKFEFLQDSSIFVPQNLRKGALKIDKVTKNQGRKRAWASIKLWQTATIITRSEPGSGGWRLASPQ